MTGYGWVLLSLLLALLAGLSKETGIVVLGLFLVQDAFHHYRIFSTISTINAINATNATNATNSSCARASQSVRSATVSSDDVGDGEHTTSVGASVRNDRRNKNDLTPPIIITQVKATVHTDANTTTHTNAKRNTNINAKTHLNANDGTTNSNTSTHGSTELSAWLKMQPGAEATPVSTSSRNTESRRLWLHAHFVLRQLMVLAVGVGFVYVRRWVGGGRLTMKGFSEVGGMCM